MPSWRCVSISHAWRVGTPDLCRLPCKLRSSTRGTLKPSPQQLGPSVSKTRRQTSPRCLLGACWTTTCGRWSTSPSAIGWCRLSLGRRRSRAGEGLTSASSPVRSLKVCAHVCVSFLREQHTDVSPCQRTGPPRSPLLSKLLLAYRDRFRWMCVPSARMKAPMDKDFWPSDVTSGYVEEVHTLNDASHTCAPVTSCLVLPANAVHHTCTVRRCCPRNRRRSCWRARSGGLWTGAAQWRCCRRTRRDGTARPAFMTTR